MEFVIINLHITPFPNGSQRQENELINISKSVANQLAT